MAITDQRVMVLYQGSGDFLSDCTGVLLPFGSRTISHRPPIVGSPNLLAFESFRQLDGVNPSSHEAVHATMPFRSTSHETAVLLSLPAVQRCTRMPRR